MPRNVPSIAPIAMPSGSARRISERLPRRKAFKAGIVSYQNHSLSHDCIVRDMSVKGARLRFEQHTVVPDNFTLIIPVEGKKVDCQIKWRNDVELGVEFTSEVQPDKRNVRDQKVDVEYVIPRKPSLRKR